jgi:hypothetical protein
VWGAECGVWGVGCGGVRSDVRGAEVWSVECGMRDVGFNKVGRNM